MGWLIALGAAGSFGALVALCWRYPQIVDTYYQAGEEMHQELLQQTSSSAQIVEGRSPSAPMASTSVPSTSVPPAPTPVEPRQVIATPSLGIATAFSSEALDALLSDSSTQIDVDIPESIDERKQWLLERLKADFPQLIKCIKGNPVMIVGAQRSGKTTIASIIGLLRQIYLGIPMLTCTPHIEPGNPFPESFKTHGLGGDYDAIAKVMHIYLSLIKDNDLRYIGFVWDEYTRYVDEFPLEYQALAGKLIKSAFSESSKHNKLQILIAHNETADAFGGTKNTHQMRKEGCIKIKRYPELDELGEAYPSPKVRISGLNKGFDSHESYEDCILPDWLTPEYLLRLFPHLGAWGDSPDSEAIRLEQGSSVDSGLPNRESGSNSEAIRDDCELEITVTERGKVVELIRSGEARINKILSEVWGAKPGDNSKYKTARAKFDQIKKDIR